MTIEDVFTIIKSTKSAPNGGHVCVFRPSELPEAGQVLTQGEQRWPILGVETFHGGCFGGFKEGHNVGILVSRELPKPECGAAVIEGS